MPGPRPLPIPIAALACLLLSLAPAARAQQAASSSVPSDPAFSALLVDGTTASGQLRRLGPEGVTLGQADGTERPIGFDRLVKLTREGASPPSWANEGEVVLFPDGDRLTHCAIAAAGPADLDVQPVALGKVPVPLDSILGLIFKTTDLGSIVRGAEADALDALEAQVRSTPRTTELLWLGNGDRVPGILAGLDEKKVAFRRPTGPSSIDRSAVVALGFAPGQINYPAPAGPYLELTLLDSTRLGMLGVRVEHGQVLGTTRFGAQVRFPVGDLAQARAMGGSVAYLSDREASGTQYVPYVGPTRPYRRNASVLGTPLRVGGRAFDRGLGTQSRTLLAYRLDSGSKRFQATVGLDDGAGQLGNVAFKVLVDGKARFESPPMGAGEPPRVVDVDLENAKVLILITEFGERGDVQDAGDWADARIIR